MGPFRDIHCILASLIFKMSLQLSHANPFMILLFVLSKIVLSYIVETCLKQVLLICLMAVDCQMLNVDCSNFYLLSNVTKSCIEPILCKKVIAGRSRATISVRIKFSGKSSKNFEEYVEQCLVRKRMDSSEK